MNWGADFIGTGVVCGGSHMNDIMKLASGPVMWTISLVTIGIAILESVLIYQRAKKFVVKTNLLTSGEMKMCMKTGGIVAIGPATSAFVVSLSMISMLGAPITLMRVGMIGAPAHQLFRRGPDFFGLACFFLTD